MTNKIKGLRAIALFGATTACVVGASLSLSPAQAYVTNDLYLYLDYSNSSSYDGTSTWHDLSPNHRDGTINGAIVADPSTNSLSFPGGSSGTAWVDLTGDFSDFSQGMTIEFEGSFGQTRDAWERIFDFGNGPESDNVWVGQYATTNELAVEVFTSGNHREGWCHTQTGNTALGPIGQEEFARWTITLDGTLCKIYKDGVAMTTFTDKPELYGAADTQVGGSNSGTLLNLPDVITRNHNYLGRSNWTGDNDLEGKIRSIRIYTAPLTPAEVAENSSDTPLEESTATSDLADTGFNSTPLFMGAGTLAILGAALTALGKRRAR